jgi:hypothetical protein
MKKLSLSELESYQAGAPEDCVDALASRAGVLLADPLFYLIFYDAPLLTCIVK